MRAAKFLSLFVLTAAALSVSGDRAEGNNLAYRQYYGGWSYYPTKRYYYRYYYYKPVVTYKTYSYHYCIHYPSRPRYVYYYNPRRRVYWGRFDLKGKKGEQYSLLAQKDRKEELEDIPESAFPKPGEMPKIPESEDGESIEPPPKDDLPKGEPKE